MQQEKRAPDGALKVIIVVVLAVVVGLVIYAKNSSGERAGGEAPGKGGAAGVAAVPSAPPADASPASAPLPKLVDLGAGKCIPCKMMAPILEELKHEYAGRLDVVFIDVWENRGAGETYGIRVIPTQIFFDPNGNEIFRHEGFYSKEDILSKWAELGYTF
ncbi:thioredoxin family protein [bacterium]|nr:thioredoxin family protein [bacterium]